MLLELMRESYSRHHAEFDFLIGDEGYKWHFATHNRAVGPMGNPPWSLRLRKAGKKHLKSVLVRYPVAFDAARALKKRLGW
jgi:CelD/BcsL family acetyltransferase involved in cellulose biosynthesis